LQYVQYLRIVHDMAETAGPPHRVDAGRLVLRRIQATDAGAAAAAVSVSLDHLRPWLPWATPESAGRPGQLARVAQADQMWAAGISYLYSVMTVTHGTLIGEIALQRWPDGCIEIGYWIAAGRAGHGFGTAAARAMTSVALALPGVRRAEIHCDAANAASATIPRKLGYRLDRVERRRSGAPGESGRLMVWVRDRADTE